MTPSCRGPPRNRAPRLVDLRRNDEHNVADRQGLRADCLRIHTVGNDCSCGKMVTAVELSAAWSARASMRPSWLPARPASLWPAAAALSIA